MFLAVSGMVKGTFLSVLFERLVLASVTSQLGCVAALQVMVPLSRVTWYSRTGTNSSRALISAAPAGPALSSNTSENTHIHTYKMAGSNIYSENQDDDDDDDDEG